MHRLVELLNIDGIPANKIEGNKIFKKAFEHTFNNNFFINS